MDVVARKRRAHEEAEVDSEGSWAISYGDMVTLLMCFFILFFSLERPKDDKKVERSALLQRALLDAFKPTGSNSAESRGGDAGAKAATSLGDRREVGVDPKVLDSFKGRAIQAGDAIIVDFEATSFYDSGSFQLNRAGHKALESFISKFQPYVGNHVLTVQAFTDRRKVARKKGRLFKDNLELSALRAVAAIRWLQAHGVPLNRMRAGGYGEMRWTADELAKATADRREPASVRHELDRKLIVVIRPEGKAEP